MTRTSLPVAASKSLTLEEEEVRSRPEKTAMRRPSGLQARLEGPPAPFQARVRSSLPVALSRTWRVTRGGRTGGPPGTTKRVPSGLRTGTQEGLDCQATEKRSAWARRWR
jgi:hypothetical protein